MSELASVLIVAIIFLLLIIPGLFMIFIFFVDRFQRKHSVLKNYPLIGRVRYLLENIGPELRQYLFNPDHGTQPFSRKDYQDIVLPAKYKKRLLSFGSKRDFDEPGYYIKNAMFPKLEEELARSEEGSVGKKRRS